MSAWTYLLLSEIGEVYLGATTNLRVRFRAHNTANTKRWTRGRQWHLLAVRVFDTRDEAFAYESELKNRPDKKIVWKLQNVERACRLVDRNSYSFNPHDWLKMHHPKYVRAAARQKNAP